jgi:hypothetical protein
MESTLRVAKKNVYQIEPQQIKMVAERLMSEEVHFIASGTTKKSIEPKCAIKSFFAAKGVLCRLKAYF